MLIASRVARSFRERHISGLMDAISKLRSALVERYQIEREIGAGGMATVYLARDPRHDRNVALKVLNPELGAVLGVERFLAEIKVTANLQHPNLLPLFDSGEADGLLFYVMPFVEGESLRARLDREKQLPIDEAIRIAVAVANALDYAHAHHVIHRDLKPENILLQAGQPVVADFGIALAVSKAGGNRVTQTGLSLGTPQYMSPEQATGDRTIDGRTDIYSLGALTYEMLTGEPPHIGHTSQAIIARLLTDKPRSVRASRPAVPEHVDAAVAQALEKLPADRFSKAKEFADALQGRAGVSAASTSRIAPPVPATRGDRLRDPITLALAGVAVVAIAVAASALLRGNADGPVPPIRFVFSAPDSFKPLDLFPWPAAISPDGRVVVYSVGQRGLQSMFYSIRTDQLEPRPIPGTTGAYQPYFSPDGQWVAFQSSGQEKKVRLDGSAPVTIAAGGSANGADWTIRNEIVSGATLNLAGLARVNAAGGTMAEFTHPDTGKGEKQHVWPIAAPDGDHVVFTIWYGNLEASQLAVASIESGRVSELGIKGIRPLAVLDGRLVYLQADGTVMAVALDVKKGRVVGNAVPVHDPVPVMSGNNGNSGAFISRGGALVTSRGNLKGQLMWLTSDGGRRVILPEARSYLQPTLSPDERRLAVLVTENRRTDIWVYDFTTTTFSRLTTTGTVSSVDWSSDGTHLIYSGGGDRERTGFWRQLSTGGFAAEKLLEMGDLAPTVALSPDARWLVVQVYRDNTWDIYRAALDSTPVTARPFVATDANENLPRFSPDGRWVAFLSDESGRSEVYVRSFPDPTARVQISAEGAQELRWSDDGDRLYYRSGGSLLAARLQYSPGFRVVRRDTVMTAPFQAMLNFGSSYDIARDGRILTFLSNRDDFELIVSPNWITEFREKIAASERTGRR
jgi:serine/threonine protein kinase/Tol biopolymer transport system component